MSIDWDEYDAFEIFEALRTAPKVAGPWTDILPKNPECPMEGRFSPKGKLVTCRSKTEELPADMQEFLERIKKHQACRNSTPSRQVCDRGLRDRGFLVVGDPPKGAS